MPEELPQKRYLVTGCAGLIGASVCRSLLAAGHHVVGIDDLNPSYDPRMKAWRLGILRRCGTFHFHQFDVADRVLVDDFFRTATLSGLFDAVFHLAAQTGVRPSVDNPWVYYNTNLTGTLHLLDACRTQGVAKFVLASTSSVYGEAEVPFRESHDASRPLSPYAASKKAAEELAYSYHALFGLDISVLRFFTVYGPAGRPDMSVFRFVRQIAEGEPLVVYGDGSQRRDFTYVEDIARGTIAAAMPVGYEVINLGGDRPFALSELIRLIAARLEREPRIEYRAAHAADVQDTWAEISKARALLSWQPEVSLEQGLTATIDWYLQNRALAGQISL